MCLSSSLCDMWWCRLGTACVCRYRGATFIYVRAIQTSKIYLISEKKSNQWLSICYETEVIGNIVTTVILNVEVQLSNS